MRSWGFVLVGVVLLGACAAEAAQRVSVFLKGGIGDYTGELGGLTNPGPAWGLTVDVQPLKMLGLEVGYEGSRNQIDGSVAAGGALLRNGGSAMVKLAPPLIDFIKPFVGAGVGATRVTLMGDGSGLDKSEWAQEIPLALGIEFNTRRLTAGIRGTYRLLPGSEFAPGFGSAPGNFIDTEATLGGRF